MFSLAAIVLLGGQFMMALWANGARETFATTLVALVGLSYVSWNLSAFRVADITTIFKSGLFGSIS